MEDSIEELVSLGTGGGKHMKPYNYRFEKVLMFREQEKNETEIEFKEAVQAFEIVATQLYDLLKKKEDTLVEQQEKMTTGFSVNEIHHYARFIGSLEKRIADCATASDASPLENELV